MGRNFQSTTTNMKEETKELATDLGNVKALSDKTNEEQAAEDSASFAIVSPEDFITQAEVVLELMDALNGKLKRLGVRISPATVGFHRSLTPATIRENLVRAQIIPEVKVGSTEDQNGIPSWLLGNLCD
jgi:hypothetical protein